MTSIRTSRVSSPADLVDLLRTEFADARAAHQLFAGLLQHETYDRGFCLKLFEVANEAGGAAWGIRRLAILMLEHQILKLDPADSEEFDFLFTQLNLKQSPLSKGRIAGSVLKEGYTTTEVSGFTSEFRRKLERHHHVHEPAAETWPSLARPRSNPVRRYGAATAIRLIAKDLPATIHLDRNRSYGQGSTSGRCIGGEWRGGVME